MIDFVHLHVHSPYTFLGSGSSLWRLVQRARELGFHSLALTDHQSLAGAARFQELMREAGLKAIFGSEVSLYNGHHLLLLAKDNQGYQNLSQLLTASHLNNPRGQPMVEWGILEHYHQGLIALSGCRRGEIPSWLLQGDYLQAKEAALRYLEIFGKDFYLEVQGDLLPGQTRLNTGLQKLESELEIPLVMTNNVHYAVKEDFPVFDILTCVEHQLTLGEVSGIRRLNAENYLKSAEQMQGLFREQPQILTRSAQIAEECNVSLGQRSFFPQYPLPTSAARLEFLHELTWSGAQERYGEITLPIRERLEYELGVIGELGFADYFLVVWDALQFAKRKGIRFAGRGSAADSAVAYCLHITEVDSIGRGLLFERFLSVERAEKPDIDIDFDSRYRDQVAHYFKERYGNERVAAVGTYQTFRARSALRAVGKVMGFAQEELDGLAKRMPWIKADGIREALDFYPELRTLSSEQRERYGQLFYFCTQISEFPKFLGTHLGGIVVSNEPISRIVPMQWSGKGEYVLQADKRDVEELGLFKIDLLSLRTLSVVEDSIRDVRKQSPDFREEDTVREDERVFARLQSGETIGMFQLESPAQRALQTRLKANKFEDIVASVALIRPGPIQGDMVEPYIERRNGLRPVEYLHPALEPILRKTYGVVLFQEQAIEIVQKVAGFTLGEADRLRRTMSHARSHEEMRQIGLQFEQQAKERGVEQGVAREIFSYLVGYASYGFCEAHAAAFATTSLKTAHLIEYYPAAFFTALFNHQPMGFYSPNSLSLEAKRRGVKLLPLDVQRSGWDFQSEGDNIRVGLKQLKNMRQEDADKLLAAQMERAFSSWPDFMERVQLSRPVLENLVLAGGLDSVYGNRKALLWELRQGRSQGLFAHADSLTLINYPDFTLLEKTEWEYRLLGLNTTYRLMELWRKAYGWQEQPNTDTVRNLASGQRVALIGVILHPHRPPTRSGQVVVFFTLEDEFGFLDVTMFERDYQKWGEWIFGQRKGPRLVSGVIQRRGEGISLVADAVYPPSKNL